MEFADDHSVEMRLEGEASVEIELVREFDHRQVAMGVHRAERVGIVEGVHAFS